jgi:hypothetical protein
MYNRPITFFALHCLDVDGHIALAATAWPHGSGSGRWPTK